MAQAKITWTPATTADARECESLFQNGGPKVYVRDVSHDWRPMRPSPYSAQRAVELAEAHEVVYARRHTRGEDRRYAWFVAQVKTETRYVVSIGANFVADLVPEPNPFAPGTTSPYVRDAYKFDNRNTAIKAAADWAAKNMDVRVTVRNADTLAMVAEFCQYREV